MSAISFTEHLHIQKYVMGPMGTQHTHYWNSWMQAAAENENAYKIVKRYMKRSAEELYDTQKDPYELNNLADNTQYADIKKRLSKALDRWMKEQDDPGAFLDTQERLRQSRQSARK